MSITVKLPHRATGEQIIKAFSAAGTFDVSSSKRWRVYSYPTINGTASISNTFLPETECYATREYLWVQGRIHRLFWGKKDPVWKVSPGVTKKFAVQIHLLPIAPESIYTEILLDVNYEYDHDQGGFVSRADQPNDREFARYKPYYEKIVQSLLRNLQ